MDTPGPRGTVTGVTVPVRPSLTHARRVRAVTATVAVIGAVIVAVLALTGSLNLTDPARVRAQVPTGPAPWDYTLPAWDLALGGDEGLTSANYEELAAGIDEDLAGEGVTLRGLATQVVLADLTAAGQAPLRTLTPPGLAPYWPEVGSVAPTAQCTDVTILALAPAALPVSGSDARALGLFSRYAKTLVAYEGTCAGMTYTVTDPGVEYVYAGLGETGWVPLRYWQVPADAGLDTFPGATEPYDWELAELTGPCAGTTLIRARISVADAFEMMCAEASANGVQLVASSGYRSRAEQALLFEDAVVAYGSEAAARQRVAYADDLVCTSRHCSGLALNVTEDPAALAWLTTVVGCVSSQGTVTAAATCPSDQTPVPNAARWGFAAPLAVSPGYLEFTLPIGADGTSSLGTPNCAPAGIAVANQVASIFRCRLAREGIVGADQEQVVAEALTISRCESGWNATAAAFGGRFAATTHPVTGRTYTHRGVFMLTQAQAQAGWVDGGLDAVNDPAANINAAASLWLATGGWEQFGCATGADPDGFEMGPVLPVYGGPDLPAWARLY